MTVSAAFYDWTYWLTVAVLWLVIGWWTVDGARDRAVYDPLIHLLLVAVWPVVALLIGARALTDGEPSRTVLAPRGRGARTVRGGSHPDRDEGGRHG